MRMSAQLVANILAAILAFLLPGGLFGQNTPQDRPASISAQLDEALRQADSERARELVLDDPDGAEQLFLNYLQRKVNRKPPKEGEIRHLAKARFLADVFFRIYEFDFERGILAYWDKATIVQKQELLPILRDHYAVYQDARRMSRLMPPPRDRDTRLMERNLSLADRYRKVSFTKGELQAMLWAGTEMWKTWRQAKSVGDDVVEAWAAYYVGRNSGEGQVEFAAQYAVEAAERLHMPRLLQFALAFQAWRALSRDDYEAHIEYLRKGLETVRKIPVRQTMVQKSGCDFYPGEAWYLKTLWRAYKLKDIPEGQELFDQGRALSRRYGGEVGELAYLIASMQEFIRPGLLEEVASQAETLARRIGDPGWLAAFLTEKAGGLKGLREFSEALAALDEAARIYKKMDDRGHLAQCLEMRGTFRVQSNDLAGALADFGEAMKIWDKLGLTGEAIALRMHAGLALQSHPKLALKFLNEALSMAEKTQVVGDIRNVYSARAKVMATDLPAQSLEDYRKALFYCERLRDIFVYPGEVPVAMRLVSQALRRMGKYGEAVEMEKRRAEYARAEGLFNAEADAFYWLSNIYCYDLGEPGIAAGYAEKYARLLTRPGRRLTVNNCDRLAGAYLSIGQPGRALEFWAKALQLAKATPAGEHYQRMVHINAARTYLDLGDYGAAVSELEAENALIERTFQAYYDMLLRTNVDSEAYAATVPELASSDGHSQRHFQSYEDSIELQKAEWFNRIALAHALSGDLARAVKESRQAIELEFSTPPGTALADYYAYFSPGDALAQAGQLEEAIGFYKKRRDRARRVKSLPKEREALVKLGLTFEEADEIEKARGALLEAVRIDRQPPGPQVGTLAESLLALGSLELRSGNPTGAEELLTEARQTANPYDLNQIWQVERALAEVSAARKKPGRAENHFELALSALEGARERLRPEEFTLRYGIDRLQVYDEYASSLAGRAIETGQAADSEKAMRVVERRRAQALWDLMALGWARLPPDAVPEQLQRAREVEARLAAKQAILRDQFNLPPEERFPTLIAQLQGELKLAKEEHARLLTSLAQGKFRFLSPSSLPADLIGAIQNKLGPDRVLVEYLVMDESTYAFVLSPAGLKVSQLPVGRQELRKKVQGLLQPFYRLDSGDLDLARFGFNFRTAHELYLQLFAPLESRFGKASEILVVPDDVLFYLPLELLVDSAPKRRRPGDLLFAECEQAGFLVRRFTLSYLSSAAQVLGGQERRLNGAAPATLFAIANPSDGSNDGTHAEEDPVKRSLHAAASRGVFAPLPGSADEVARISRCFRAGSATVLSGSQATEASYRQLSPVSGIVHLATHAIASDDHPFYSTLILAPDAGKKEDGYLQAYEIVRSPLQARLVVLSACETAKGPLGRGEGLVGLVSAFLQAGARSVLATQWSVDESTAELMDSFYRAMTGGQSTAQALRQAKLDMLQKRLRFGRTEVSLAHPFFWAPFVLIGTGD